MAPRIGIQHNLFANPLIGECNMIKDMKVAQCDLCGSIAPAVYVYSQREDESWYTQPKDWHVSPANSQMLFCPKCWARIGEPNDRTDRT